MSLDFMDSFDDDMLADGHKGYGADAPTDAISTTYGRHDQGAWIGDSPGRQLERGITMSGDTFVLGAAMSVQTVGATANELLMYGYDTTSNQWNVRLDQSGAIHWSVGTASSRTVESSAGAVPTDGTWFYFEIKVKHSATVGTVEIRIDGDNVASGTGLDTINTSNTYIDSWRICGTTSGYVHSLYVDDLYVLDGSGSSPYNDFLGDVEVKLLLPNGNGNSSGMTGSDADQTNNYLLVDDNPIVTTDYVESSTEGHKDTYAFTDAPTSGYNVYGMQVCLVAQKDDTGTKYLRPVVRSGSTDYNGTSVALGTDWDGILEIWEQNPNTSSDWTLTTVNAAQPGQEVRDS